MNLSFFIFFSIESWKITKENIFERAFVNFENKELFSYYIKIFIFDLH